MTDYERTTTRETTTSDPTVRTTHPGGPAVVVDPPAASTVRTTERAYAPAGPSGSTLVARLVTFLFGVLQVALILRILRKRGECRTCASQRSSCDAVCAQAAANRPSEQRIGHVLFSCHEANKPDAHLRPVSART